MSHICVYRGYTRTHTTHFNPLQSTSIHFTTRSRTGRRQAVHSWQHCVCVFVCVSLCVRVSSRRPTLNVCHVAAQLPLTSCVCVCFTYHAAYVITPY